VLVFEDSLAGVRAAKAAGMTCVGVTGTHDRATLEREADAVVSRLGPHLFASAAAC
jgi:beta-phosphoglucomutase-like phosphatase (HAD superfamily)